MTVRRVARLAALACASVLAVASSATAQPFDPPCPDGLCVATGFPQDRPSLSPPIVASVSACTSLVSVSGYVPGNQIEIYLGPGASPRSLGSFSGGGGAGVFDVASGLAALGLPRQFTLGQVVRAVQRDRFAPSVLSDAVRVSAAGPPPTPRIEQPLYECGRTLGITGVGLGMTVSVVNEPVGGPSSVAVPPFVARGSAVWVGPPEPHRPTSRFRAWSELCGVTSEVGPLEPVIPAAEGPPEPLDPPVIVNQTLIAGQQTVQIPS